MLYSFATILLYSERQPRDLWIVLSLAVMFALVGLIRAFFPGAFGRIIGAFFDNTQLNQLSKEDAPFLSWPYLLLYFVMGFAVGMFVFLVNLSGFINIGYSVDVRLFLLLSLSSIVLFTVKIMVLRATAHVFDIKRMLRRYETALFLSYYNVAFLFLVFALMLSMLPFSAANWLVPLALSLAALLLIFRLGKSAFDLIRNYRFPIFYFIVYLCTLELAPILILIKIVSR